MRVIRYGAASPLHPDASTRMIELLQLTPLFRSRFGRFQLPVRPPDPPEPWEQLMRRFPTLDTSDGTGHISIFFRGERLPYSGWNLRQSGRILPWLTIEFFGPPKAGKSYISDRIHRLFRKWKVKHMLYPEYRRIDMPEINDRVLENVWRYKRSLARLVADSAQHSSARGIRRMRNFLMYDLGPLNSILFADMFETTTGTPAYAAYMEHDMSTFLPMLHIGTLVHVPPDISLARHSKLGHERLEALAAARERIPERLTRMTSTSDRPFILIDVDTSGSDKRDVSSFVTRSYGTIISDWIL